MDLAKKKKMTILALLLPCYLKEVKMSKKYKNIELKKQFDDMVYEIVKTTTLNSSDEVNNLIEKISPQIEKINNLLNEKALRV